MTRGGRALRLRVAVAASTVVLAVTGCSRSGSVSTVVRDSSSSSNQALQAQRRAAHIADCPSSDQGAASIAKGLPAVVLDCMGYDTRVNLAGLAKGTPIVLNFWAQWCGPCRTEGPWFGRTWAKAKPTGKLRMLGVDEVDQDPSGAIAMAQANGQTYPLLVDAAGAARTPFGFTALPQTFFIDGQGRIVHRQVGSLASQTELEQEIKQYLGVDLG